MDDSYVLFIDLPGEVTERCPCQTVGFLELEALSRSSVDIDQTALLG